MTAKIPTTPKRQKRLHVVIGPKHSPKVESIAERMSVEMADVVRWAIEDFNLDSFLSNRQLELTDNSTGHEQSVTQ